MMPDVDGYLLTGGASSRMGRDKALLSIGGTTLGERGANILRWCCGRVAAVGLAIPGIPTVQDDTVPRIPHAAILGLRAALHDSGTEWTAILACDLPFITQELFTLMFASAAEDLDVVVPQQSDGRLQPLAAIYRTETCARAAGEAIAKGELRLGSLVDKLRVRRLLPSEYASLKGADRFFFNINSPTDLSIAERMITSER